MARTRVTPGLGRLTQRAVPAPTAALPGTHRSYTSESGCSVIVSREPARREPAGLTLPTSELLLWHLSIAHAERYPTWDEVADARYALIPDDVTMALLLPPADQYVNVHAHCLHLWEIDDPRA